MDELGKWLLGTVKGQVVFSVINTIVFLLLAKLSTFFLRRAKGLRDGMRRSTEEFQVFIEAADTPSLAVFATQYASLAASSAAISGACITVSGVLMLLHEVKGSSLGPSWLFMMGSYISLLLWLLTTQRIRRIRLVVSGRVSLGAPKPAADDITKIA